MHIMFLHLLLGSSCFVSVIRGNFLKSDFEECIVDVYNCNKCNRLFYLDITFGKFLN